MRETDLLNIKIPKAHVNVQENNIKIFSGTVRFQLQKDGVDLWYLIGDIESERGSETEKLLLESEDIIDILDDTLSVDAYCQDEPFKAHMQELSETLVRKVAANHSDLRSANVTISVSIEPYILQRHAVPGEATNFLKILADDIKAEMRKVQIPEHLKVPAPTKYLPDPVVLESLAQRIYEGVPAVAILGPTGAGKSALARYVLSNLNRKGYAGYIIDANARIEGDRLFDRDDFDANGTFILEGVLCRLARETKKIDVKLIVVLEEYNAFSDQTRREFYRLFSDEDRCYPIQSSKDGKLLDTVGFSHVQFLLTANPLSSDKYLTDDLKRLSNAELRRLVLLYLDYEQDKERIKSILRAILCKKAGFQRLKKPVPDIESRINWELGVDVFLALNERKEGDTLGYDVGYSSVADMLWTSLLRSHHSDHLVIALTEHILNGIADTNLRTLAAERIRQATNIEIPKEILLRDA